MKPRLFTRAWGPVALWMALIFFLSAQSELPTFPGIVAERIIEKGAHFVEYTILAGLCWRALRLTVSTHYSAIVAFVITVLYALGDELHQLFVPRRHGDLTDVIADSLGAAFGLAVMQVWQARQSGNSLWRRRGQNGGRHTST